jgi:hypothetical protein
MKEVDLGYDWYSQTDHKQKDIFVVLQKNKNFLLTTKAILSRFELNVARSPFQIETDKCTFLQFKNTLFFCFSIHLQFIFEAILETLFNEKLKLPCPWKTMRGLQKFQQGHD